MNGKVIVITGASGGIGAAVARLAAQHGAHLVLVARREEALRSIAAECGRQAHFVVADMTERGEVRRVVGEACLRCGGIDIWVNNVGQGISRAPSELTDADVDEMMRINVKTALYGMQEVLPHFKERGTGHLINVSSMLGRIPLAIPRAAYNGAKHFLNALTANFRSEVQATHPDIHVSLVSPGVVYTDFGKHAVHGGPESRQFPGGQEVDAVAAVILNVMRTRRPDVYTLPGSHDRVVGYFDALGKDP